MADSQVTIKIATAVELSALKTLENQLSRQVVVAREMGKPFEAQAEKLASVQGKIATVVAAQAKLNEADRAGVAAKERAAAAEAKLAAEQAKRAAGAKVASGVAAVGGAAGALPPPLPTQDTEKFGNAQMSAATKAMMLEHAIRSTIDSAMMGMSPLRALAMEAGRLGPAFGMGLGGMIGLQVVSLAVSAFERLREEALKLKNDIHDALAFENPDFHSVDELQKKLESVHETVIKLREATGAGSDVLSGKTMSHVGLGAVTTSDLSSGALAALQMSMNAAGFGGVINPLMKARDQHGQEQLDNLGTVRRAEAGLEQGVANKSLQQEQEHKMAQTEGEDAAGRAKAKREHDEAYGATLELDPGARKTAREAIDLQYANELARLDEVKRKKHEEIALEIELAKIKERGDYRNAPVQEADSRIEHAQRAVDAARNPEEAAAAAGELAKAQADKAAMLRDRKAKDDDLKADAAITAARTRGDNGEAIKLERQREYNRLIREGVAPETAATAADAKAAQAQKELAIRQAELALEAQINQALATGNGAMAKRAEESLKYIQEYRKFKDAGYSDAQAKAGAAAAVGKDRRETAIHQTEARLDVAAKDATLHGDPAGARKAEAAKTWLSEYQRLTGLGLSDKEAQKGAMTMAAKHGDGMSHFVSASTSGGNAARLAAAGARVNQSDGELVRSAVEAMKKELGGKLDKLINKGPGEAVFGR